MGSFLPEESFRSIGNYGRALAQTPQRLGQRVFARSSLGEEIGAMVKRSGEGMKKSLNWWDLLWMTIGSVIGAGVFVLTGQEAHSTAGPAIILSYAAAGFAAMLAVLSYTEFAVEIPVAGGSFAYLRVELGDFIAYIGAGNIILEYIVGGAAVARAWTSYFASLINTQPNSIRLHVSSFPYDYSYLDPIAVAVLLVTMMIAIWSTKWTAIVNWTAGVVNMAIIAFVIIAGLAHANSYNFTHSGDPTLKGGFLPFGAHGVFQAASVLFFAYLGFDAVTTMAEETKNPGRDMPIGLVGAMVLTTIVYMLMALALTLMVPYGLINDEAPFSYAFEYVGWNWAKYLVALGALKGITTVILVANVGQARYLTHIARTHMISPWFAKVNKYTQTPINATASMVIATCVVALFTDLNVLGNLLSVSTLFIFSLVSMALLVRRYYDPVETTRKEFLIFLSASFVIVAASIAIAGYWAATNADSKWVGYVIIFPFWVLGTLAIQLFCPQRRKPTTWGVPLVPWIPSLTIAVNMFLLGSMDKDSFIRFSVWTAAILVYYFFVGLHASYDAATDLAVETAKGVDQMGGGPEDGIIHPDQQTLKPHRAADYE
ncbi:unnamed protein product [Calypogeia fissa]